MIFQIIFFSDAKLFADDTSIFLVVNGANASEKELIKINDLKKGNDWTFQWKMSFNSDPSKQAQAGIFSRK